MKLLVISCIVFILSCTPEPVTSVYVDCGGPWRHIGDCKTGQVMDCTTGYILGIVNRNCDTPRFIIKCDNKIEMISSRGCKVRTVLN